MNESVKQRQQEKAVSLSKKSSMKTSTRNFMNGYLCVVVCGVFLCYFFFLPTIASGSEKNVFCVFVFLKIPEKSVKFCLCPQKIQF